MYFNFEPCFFSVPLEKQTKQHEKFNELKINIQKSTCS